jgi:hypothetical protein
VLANTLVRSRSIEVDDIFTDNAVQMSFTQNEHVIQAFAPHTTDEPFANRVNLWCSHRGSEQVDPPIFSHAGENMYRRMVPLLTRLPSFNSSPRMRFVPQRRFSRAICLINAIVSSDRRGLRTLPFD